MPDLHVAEEQLTRPEIGAAFQQVCGIRMVHEVRRAAFAEPGATGRDDTSLPEDLGVMGLSARQPSTVPGNSHVFGRIHR